MYETNWPVIIKDISQLTVLILFSTAMMGFAVKKTLQWVRGIF